MRKLKIAIMMIIILLITGSYKTVSAYTLGKNDDITDMYDTSNLYGCTNLYCVWYGKKMDWNVTYYRRTIITIEGNSVYFEQYGGNTSGQITGLIKSGWGNTTENNNILAAILWGQEGYGPWKGDYTDTQLGLFQFLSTWTSTSGVGSYGGVNIGGYSSDTGTTVVSNARASSKEWEYSATIHLLEHVLHTKQTLMAVYDLDRDRKEPPTTNITVKKIWDDETDAYGNRPDEVYFNVYNSSNSLVRENVKVTGAKNVNTWTATVTGVPSGTTYYASESALGGGYKNPSPNGLEVTNSLARTSVTVTKVWDDDNNRDGKRANATVTLYETINGTTTASKDSSGNVRTGTLGTSDNATVKFDNLPTHRNGQQIIYTVDETSVPTGYTKSVNGATITNTHVPERISISVKKVWDDVSNKENTRPANIQIVLKKGNTTVQTKTLSGTGKEWTTTFENLYKYENGREINYTVEEVGVPESTKECAVSVTITGSKSSGFTVTNKFVPKTEYNVYKRWNDDNNRDGLRPTEIEVTLYADGVKVSKDGDGNSITNPIKIKPNSKGEWKYKFENLLKYNSKEELIVYTVQEKVPSRYEVEIITN